MRFVRPLAPALAVAALLAAGCGSSGDSPYGKRSVTEQAETATRARSTATTRTAPAGASAQSCDGGGAGVAELRVTGVGCGTGEAVAAGWGRITSCASPAGSSRFACTVRGYRCLGVSTDRGIAVSCARASRSIAFVATRS